MTTHVPALTRGSAPAAWWPTRCTGRQWSDRHGPRAAACRLHLAASAARRYPVLEAFHGYPSQPLNWMKVFHIRQAVEARVRAHQLHPTLVVMPQIEIPRGLDTEGVNGGPGKPQVETWLTRDVPDWVGQHFRVIANRNAWATIGYSAGGFVAAMATVLHPAQYSAGIVMGGYFRPDFGPFYEPFTAKSRSGKYYDLRHVAPRRPPPVSLWVETSHADRSPTRPARGSCTSPGPRRPCTPWSCRTPATGTRSG